MSVDSTASPVAAWIFNHGDTRIFSLSEAQEMLPVLIKITSIAYNQLEPLQKRIDCMLDCDPRLKDSQFAYETIVMKWVDKARRLGLHVPGLWQIGFDTGDGYICWRFPEIKLAYFGNYIDSFQDRRSIVEIIEEYQPEWAGQ